VVILSCRNPELLQSCGSADKQSEEIYKVLKKKIDWQKPEIVEVNLISNIKKEKGNE
jgi:hypothetical protein